MGLERWHEGGGCGNRTGFTADMLCRVVKSLNSTKACSDDSKPAASVYLLSELCLLFELSAVLASIFAPDAESCTAGLGCGFRVLSMKVSDFMLKGSSLAVCMSH